MRLFHQIEEQDQHNSIHYCMHLVIDTLLEGSCKLEVNQEDDKISQNILDEIIQEAREMPESDQFGFLADHEIVGQMIFDLAIEEAQTSYYADGTDNVIHYEELRFDDGEHSEEAEPEDTIEEAVIPTPKKQSLLN